MDNKDNKFSFAISLSVLDHLGRHLYRSFVTVLGEAISNSWDADATNVRLYVDRENNTLVIKDDGCGMTADDFQDKFLKIGYSKRKTGESTSQKGRPFIGRKGIGKLALLSCAKEITVISKAEGQPYIGGVIDNSGLDEAITDDLTPGEYELGTWDEDLISPHTKDHEHGTIIYFKDINEGIKNSVEFLKKMLALYFRFALLDDSFNIFLEDEEISLDHLNDLAEKTEFLWNINELNDPYIQEKLQNLKEARALTADGDFKGFVASVSKPRYLKIIAAEERVSVDLFVNGRLREKDVLRHIPTARVAESYLYGQIHCNDFDDDVDRFTSSREGIVADDPRFNKLLVDLEKVIRIIIDDWDKWRIKNRKEGDPENPRITPKERKARELFNAVSEEYDLPEESENRSKVNDWVDELSDDAAFNFESYAECFISENLIRKYIQEKGIPISGVAQTEIDEWKRRETIQKQEGNINIDIRRNNDDLSYLDMSFLVKQADTSGVQNTLHTDSKEYRPIRNAVAHTSLLTEDAKRKLNSVYSNIKGRIINLLS